MSDRYYTKADVFALCATAESVLRCMREGKPFFPDGSYADRLDLVLEPFRHAAMPMPPPPDQPGESADERSDDE